MDGIYRLIEAPVDRIVPGDNARRDFDEGDLRELAASLRDSRGAIQPGRAWWSESAGEDGGGAYVLIAGERRWRAHQIAGLATMWLMVGPEPSEPEKLKWNLVENLQRASLRPRETVDRVTRMLGLTDPGTGLPLWSQAALAEELGKSLAWVDSCVTAALAPAATLEALEAGVVGLDVVALIGSLPAGLRERAHGEMVARPFGGAMTREEAARHVAENFRRDLRRAEFDPEDEELVRGCPACSGCAWNGGNRDDVAGRHRHSVCLNPPCYEAKARAHAARRRERESDTVGVSVLEAGAAARLFQPWNNAVDPSSGYVDVNDRPDAYLLTESARLSDRDALPRWEQLVADAEVPVKIAFDHEGRERRLLEVKPATLAALRSRWAGLFKGGAEEKLLTADEKKAAAAVRKATEAARRSALLEGCGELVWGLAGRCDGGSEADEEWWEEVIRLAAEGALQREDIGFVCGVLGGKGDSLEGLLEVVRGLEQVGSGKWPAVLVLILRTRAIRYHGYEGPDWEAEAPLGRLAAMVGFGVKGWRDKLSRRVRAAEKASVGA